MTGPDPSAAVEAARQRLADLEEKRFEAIEHGGRPSDPALIREAERDLAHAEFMAAEGAAE